MVARRAIRPAERCQRSSGICIQRAGLLLGRRHLQSGRQSLKTWKLPARMTISVIARATEEQAVSIIQINQNIEQISGIVQANTASAEESAAISEELSSQAKRLKELTGQFRLKRG